jgi:hypothetical protein
MWALEAITDSMEATYKKQKEYVPLISQCNHLLIFSLTSYTHCTNTELQSFCHGAQSLTHHLRPFTNIKIIFIIGIQLEARINLPLEQQPSPKVSVTTFLLLTADNSACLVTP